MYTDALSLSDLNMASKQKVHLTTGPTPRCQWFSPATWYCIWILAKILTSHAPSTSHLIPTATSTQRYLLPPSAEQRNEPRTHQFVQASMTAVGAAKPSAQGQATTKTEIAIIKLKVFASCRPRSSETSTADVYVREDCAVRVSLRDLL